jgi:hypothetical protein
VRECLDKFVSRQNVEYLKKQLGKNPNDAQRRILSTLPAEEAAKATEAEPKSRA